MSSELIAIACGTNNVVIYQMTIDSLQDQIAESGTFYKGRGKVNHRILNHS